MFLRLFLPLLIASCTHTRVGTPIITKTCPPTKVVKMGKWLKIDQWNMNTAVKECPKRYNGRSPCLVYFEKTKPYSYRALCGEKR